MTPRRRPFPITAHQLLIASAAAAGAFALLGAIAMTRPTTTTVTAKTRYTEKVDFGYHAAASARPVYPRGIVRTGDPVFLRLVRRVRVRADYRFASAAPHQISGSLAVSARLSSPNGWTRSIRLAAPARFTGDHASRTVTLDLPRLRARINRIEGLIGMSSGGTYTLAVIARPNLAGTLVRQPLDGDFAPALNFQLDALQLRPGAAQSTTGDQQDSVTPSRRAFVATAASAPNTLSIRGHGLPVAAARWIALYGLLLAAAAALLAHRRLPRPHASAARIQLRYGHLIVPITTITHSPALPRIDVSTIKALAQLADRSQRLILHQHHDNADNYLVDDEGTLYRYQTPGSAPPRDRPTVHHAAAPTTRPTSHQPSSGPPRPTPTRTTPPMPTPTARRRHRRRTPGRAAEAWLGWLRTRSSAPSPHTPSATPPIARNTGP